MNISNISNPNNITKHKDSLHKVPGPKEINTNKYVKKPLYIVAYIISENEEPLSYHRIYESTFYRMVEILQFVEEYYLKNKGKSKLSLNELSTNLKIPYATLRTTVQLMSSSRYIMKRENDSWIMIRKGQMLAMQQKPKYSNPKYWGKRTPIYIYNIDTITKPKKSSKN